MSGNLVAGPDRRGRRVAIADGLVAAEAPADARRLDCADDVIMPGAVCAHTHLYSGLARYDMPAAAPAPANFIEILSRVWWRLDRALDAAARRAAARDYIAQALLSGTTTLVDHHESPALIEGSLALLAEACDELGIRALLCYGATERNFGADEAVRGLAECRSIGDTPLRRVLVGLHACFTVSDPTIRAAGELAREMGTVLHIHVAEDGADVSDAKERGYAGPLERLAALDALVPGSILAHGVHLSAAQVRRASEQGCWLVHNPRSNRGNRVGYAAALSAGSKVALGTDGWPADMAAEEKALAELAAEHGDTGIVGRLAAGHGLVAERFGTAAEPLAPGAVGDLVVRDPQGAVRHVVVGGRLVVENGRLATADLKEIEAMAHRQAERLWRRMDSL